MKGDTSTVVCLGNVSQNMLISTIFLTHFSNTVKLRGLTIQMFLSHDQSSNLLSERDL